MTRGARSLRRDRRRQCLAALASVVIVAATAAGCSGSSDRPGPASTSRSGPSTTPSTTTPTTAGPAATSPGSTHPSPSPTAPVTPPSTVSSPHPSPVAVLPDGRHPARIVGIDLARNVVAIDVVQFFTGAAAAAAAEQDGAAEVPPPNDVWIRNENPLVRTLPVARDVPVVTNTLTAEQTGSSTRDVRISLSRLAQLPHLHQALFWVTVRGGTVTALREQYLP